MGKKRRKAETANDGGNEAHAQSKFSGIPDFVALIMVACGLSGILLSIAAYSSLGLAGFLMCGLASLAAVIFPFWINSYAGRATMHSDTGSYAADAVIGAAIIKTLTSDSDEKNKK